MKKPYFFVGFMLATFIIFKLMPKKDQPKIKLELKDIPIVISDNPQIKYQKLNSKFSQLNEIRQNAEQKMKTYQTD